MAGPSTSEAVPARADPMDEDRPDEDEDEDVVVREIDVYLCADFSATGTQLVLLQHPLRPPWRPYDYDKVQTMRMKPRAQRLEVDVPLDTRGRNYTEAVDPIKKIKNIKLRSTLAEGRATYALATLRGDKLMLAPIDYSLHLRPILDHLKDQPVGKHAQKEEGDGEGASGSARGAGGVGEEGGGEEEEEEEEAGAAGKAGGGKAAPSLTAVEVQVQKRETERQQEARLRSYAYIHAQEEEEAWKPLSLHREDSELASKLWAKYMVPKDAPLPMECRRADYLKCIAPATYSSANGGGFVGFGAPAPGAGTKRPIPAPHGGATQGGRGVTLPAASNTAAQLPRGAGGGGGGGGAGGGGGGGAAAAASSRAAASAAAASSGKSTASGAAAASAAGSSASASAAAAAAAAASAGPLLPPDVQAALPNALAATFGRSSTLNMANLRQLLAEPSLSAAVGAARVAATLGDAALHAAVLATGNVVCIRRVYVLVRTNASTTDPFRQLVLDYLKDNETFRRQNLQDLCTKKGIPFVESTYTKVVKDMCVSKGSFWSLKAGADL